MWRICTFIFEATMEFMGHLVLKCDFMYFVSRNSYVRWIRLYVCYRYSLDRVGRWRNNSSWMKRHHFRLLNLCMWNTVKWRHN